VLALQKQPLDTGPVDFDKAIIMVQNYISTREQDIQNMLAMAMAGDYSSRQGIIKYVESYLIDNQIEIIEMDAESASKEIFNKLWGLDFLQEIYDDPTVNEIRVNGPNHIYVLRNLEPEPVPMSFQNNEHIMNIISRMVMHDRGVSLNKSSPTIESMRKDGTRITATCPNVTENFTFALRKHLNRVLSPEEMFTRNTINKQVWDVLQILVQGRCNILIAGGVGSGKTTLLRTLFSVTGDKERVVVLESDRELLLSKHFPERDIVEFEEHPNTGRTLENLFRTILRYSPNRIIMGEFRGTGEARSAIEACLRGHEGSMATAHFNSPKEAIEGTARLLLAEGYSVESEIAAATVASAFNVVVQMFGDTTRGIIKLDSITDIQIDGTQITYNDILKWTPYGDDYKKGVWENINYAGERLINRVKRFGVSDEKLRKAGLIPKKGVAACS
jgi:pilus assembly protein CpaF